MSFFPSSSLERFDTSENFLPLIFFASVQKHANLRDLALIFNTQSRKRHSSSKRCNGLTFMCTTKSCPVTTSLALRSRKFRTSEWLWSTDKQKTLGTMPKGWCEAGSLQSKEITTARAKKKTLWEQRCSSSKGGECEQLWEKGTASSAYLFQRGATNGLPCYVNTKPVSATKQEV